MKKIIFLSNNDNSKGLYQWFIDNGYDVILWGDEITLDVLDSFKPDFVISYNYAKIVKADVIERMGSRIINLHTSYLPWNRGSSPNIWSFIEDTPKGVTIHQLEKGLDTGKIIFQKEFKFDANSETLASTYEALNEGVVSLLKDKWSLIESGDYEAKQQVGKGTYHKKADLQALLDGRELDYSMSIADFLEWIKKK